MPGFYCAIGDGDEDDARDAPAPLVRFYWHLTARAAVPYMAAITGRLNQRGIPFRTKVLSDPNGYGRADAGVLYLERRQASAARRHARGRPPRDRHRTSGRRSRSLAGRWRRASVWRRTLAPV